MVTCSRDVGTYHDVKDWYIISITLQAVFCVISTPICIYTLFQLCDKNILNSINKLYRILTILCILSFTICSNLDLCHTIIRFIYFPTCGNGIQLETISIVIITGLYYFAEISFYLLLLARIYNAFKLKKVIIYILITFIIIFAAIAITVCSLIVIFLGKNVSAWDRMSKYLMLTSIITDSIINILFFIVFIHQMMQTVTDLDIESTMYQKITNILTKHMVLFGIAIITNESWFLYMFIATYSGFNFVENISGYEARAMETMVNVIALWLVLNINHDKYIFWCRCCHLTVSKCCIKKRIDEKALQNPYQLLIEM